MPTPPKVDGTGWERFKGRVNDVRTFATGLTEVTLSTEATFAFGNWYERFHNRGSGDGLLPDLAARFQDYVFKLALLYAVCEGKGEISEAHIDIATRVMDWHWEANRVLFASYTHQGRELEEQIIEKLRDAPDMTMADRTMYKAIKINAEKLARIYEGMEKLGIVRPVERENRNGLRVKYHQLIQ
jgi:hypothetical protein